MITNLSVDPEIEVRDENGLFSTDCLIRIAVTFFRYAVKMIGSFGLLWKIVGFGLVRGFFLEKDSLMK